MKFHGHSPHASISMTEDPELLAHLRYRLPWVDTIIETGTHKGTGSTRFIAELCDGHQTFHTIEVDHACFLEARSNLAKFPFVHCHWGCSVSIKGALEFIKNDDALLHPDKHPDVWIDFMDDPICAYSREVLGGQVSGGSVVWEGDDLLPKLLKQHRDDRLLVVLDSAGGIGLLEFQIMLDALGNRDYLVLLDDVAHVKHFRSLAAMRAAPAFHVIEARDKWALGRHLAV